MSDRDQLSDVDLLALGKLPIIRAGYVYGDNVFCWMFRGSRDNTIPLIETTKSGEVLHAGYTTDELWQIAQDCGNDTAALSEVAQERLKELKPRFEKLERQCAELRYEVERWERIE